MSAAEGLVQRDFEKLHEAQRALVEGEYKARMLDPDYFEHLLGDTKLSISGLATDESGWGGVSADAKYGSNAGEYGSKIGVDPGTASKAVAGLGIGLDELLTVASCKKIDFGCGAEMAYTGGRDVASIGVGTWVAAGVCGGVAGLTAGLGLAVCAFGFGFVGGVATSWGIDQVRDRVAPRKGP